MSKYVLTLFFSAIGMLNYSQAQISIKSIPQKFNPEVYTHTYPASGIKKLNVALPGTIADNDFVVLYDKNTDQITVNIHTVQFEADARAAGSLTSTSLVQEADGETLTASISGGFYYECSVKTKNKKVTSVEGACFIKVEVTLPKDAKIEVYNKLNLVTKQFYPIKVEAMLKDMDSTLNTNRKDEILDQFLKSYKVTKTKPELLAVELGEIVSGYSFKDDKMNVLKRLHKYVVDRENLKVIIDGVFISSFDQKDAYKIVGIN